MDGFLYNTLEMLNTIYNNTLPEINDTKCIESIKTPLFPHQLSMVNGMNLHRDKMIHGFIVGNKVINGKIGVIGDPPGTGKTLSVLAYLASQRMNSKMTSELSYNSSKYFFSHELYELSDKSANLIIVPHSLFNQWVQDIAKHTTISYVPIETRRFLKNNIVDNIIHSNFVLTTNKCYKFVQDYATHHGIQWNNIFIDEATSIYFNSSDPPLKFQFLWFITNNWIPLFFKNPSIPKSSLYYIKDRVNINPDLERWLLDGIHYNGSLASSFLKEYVPLFHENRGLVMLRNKSIDSIHLPLLNEVIQCKPNMTLTSLSHYLSKHSAQITNVTNLFQALDIECKDVHDYTKNHEKKQDIINRKYKENECVICLDTCEYPTIVNCCYNLYCGKCLLKAMLIACKCPTCRAVLSINNICCLTLIEESKPKMNVFLDILNNNKSGKFIVYSAFSNIFYQLFEEIDKLGLKAERIDGLFSLLKIVKNFNKGKTNIIFISDIEVIRGLSLESTSHLIFYHDQPVYELKQILIHAGQRIGRQTPLKIIHLHSEIQV